MSPEMIALIASSPPAVALIIGIILAKKYMSNGEATKVLMVEVRTVLAGLTEAVKRNTAASERQTDVLSELVEKLIKERI